MKSSTVVLAVSTLWALAPLAVAQKAAAPVDLGTLGGSESVANAISAGDVVVGGGNVFSDAYQHAFLTNSKGYIEDMGSLIGVNGNSVANAISTKGAIAGTSDQIIDSNDDISSHAFYVVSLRTGMVDVGTNGGTLAEGNATEHGIVVGASTIADDGAYNAFSWTQAKGIVNLNTLAGDFGAQGYNSYAFGMNSKGTVAVGNSDSTDGTTHAVAWILATGAIKDMKTLGGSYAQASAINDSYMVVGYSTLPGDVLTDAFVTLGSGLHDIGTLGGSSAQANAVNDNGVVVGASNTTGDADVHAFIWTQNGGMVDLNSILPGGSPFIELTSANAIAEDGTIVGVGLAQDGQYHAFAW